MLTKPQNNVFFSAMLSILLLGLLLPAQAEIFLPSILSDNMVLQQNSTVKLWGWKTTKPNGEIRIMPSWSQDTIRTNGKMGDWMAEIQTPKAGGTHEILIESDFESVTINNVLIGEVWLGSGQSNMEMPLDSIHKDFPGAINFRDEIKNADFPEIRLFLVKKQYSGHKQLDLQGEWLVCTPTSVKEFSAVAYFFARKLHLDLGVPVGMIASSWGGTNAETWIDRDELNEKPHLLEPFKEMTTSTGWYPNYPAECYNSMIYPIQQFAIKGAIWYQGESNRNRPETYPEVMETLISSWREDWGIDFPFYFTQIAPYGYGRGLPSQLIREAQDKCMEIDKTGMAVTSDVGNLKHIHPSEKRVVGERLARWALAKDYGQDIIFSGPIFKEMNVKGNKAVLSFDFANGLNADQQTLELFELADESGNFFPAKASIKGQTIVLSSKSVKLPKNVRFAFSPQAQHGLYNSDGLPAPAFRTDDFEVK